MHRPRENITRGFRGTDFSATRVFMQRSPKLAASVSVSVPQSVDAATALLALMAAERGGHKTVDGRVPNDPA